MSSRHDQENQAASGQEFRVPESLRPLRQFVAWRLDPPRPSSNKPVKTPVAPLTGRNANVSDPSTWASLEQAATRAQDDRLAGIGFVFTDQDPFCGVDLDHCRDPDTGIIEPWAQEVIDGLKSYTEVSPSGTGVHVLLRGRLPEKGRRKGNVEMYDSGRYFTMTGLHLEGTPTDVEERQAELELLHERTFPQAGNARPGRGREFGAGSATLDDAEIMRLASSSINGASFLALSTGELSGHGSHSEADLAFCGMLAFWTGGRSDQIDRLFRRSGLMREKWDELRGDRTYGERTIAKALEGKTEFYTAIPSVPDSRKERAAVALTDSGNAERLVKQYGDQIRYCHAWRKWLVWDGRTWIGDSQGRALHFTKEVARNIASEARHMAGKDERKAVFAWSVRSEHVHRRQAMLKLAECEPGIAITPTELDKGLQLLSCHNGTIDLRTGKLHPHRREDYITKLVPFDFNTAATCPTWEKFLCRVIPSQDVRQFLHRALGYTATGLVSEQCLFFLHGGGANGKSTLLTAVQRVLGTGHAIQAAPELLLATHHRAHPTELASLYRVRMAVASELGAGRKFNEVLIKQLTGGDMISARRMREDFWQFDPTHKLWLGANHRPVIEGTDNGIWRRIHLIEFSETITDGERDPLLPQKLAKESEGILAWLVRGAVEYLKNGLAPPVAVIASTGEYRAEMDVIGRFLDERTSQSTGAVARSSHLYAAYKSWCEEEGEARLSSAAFGRALTERGHTRKKVNGGCVAYRGLKLLGPGSTGRGEKGGLGGNFDTARHTPTSRGSRAKPGPNPPNPPSTACDPEPGHGEETA